MEGTTSASVYKGLRWLQGTKHFVFVCVVSNDKDPQMKCDATELYLWGVACRLMYVLFIYFSGIFFIILIIATQSTLI